MDMENLMVTPAMYRDIGASYLPYSMPMMMPMMPMYPQYGIYGGAQLKPLGNDKFEGQQKKKAEAKESGKTAAAIAGSLVAAGLLIGSRGKIKAKLGGKVTTSKWAQKVKTSKTYRKARVVAHNIAKKVKAPFVAGYNKIKGLFNKTPKTTP